jgi:hypothetical protein
MVKVYCLKVVVTLYQKNIIIGDYVNDKTAQNELFDVLDDTVMDFSEKNPFGDAGSAN